MTYGRTYLLEDQEREERLVSRAEKAEARVAELESHLAGVEALENVNEDGYERDTKALRVRVAELEASLRRLDGLHDETIRAEKAEARVAELELGIKRLVWANDGTTAERPDIAWRDLKRLVCSKETT